MRAIAIIGECGQQFDLVLVCVTQAIYLHFQSFAVHGFCNPNYSTLKNLKSLDAFECYT